MTVFPQLVIPETLAAGPGPGNTDPRVLERFAKTGVADHMQKDVLRGMIEAKLGKAMPRLKIMSDSSPASVKNSRSICGRRAETIGKILCLGEG